MNSAAASHENTLPDGRLVAWYGDDFTGATAVMEVLTFSSLPSVLFFDIPTADQLARFADYRGIGIAGVARSKPPGWMDRHLPPIFDAIASYGAAITHYKVCSTFDSAPHVGSIGRAAEIAIPKLGGAWHPLLVAAPEIERYQAFGNLFAGIGGLPYRLDRHPVMSRHPVTPMDEADVPRHLARQTGVPIGLINLIDLSGDAENALRREIGACARIIAIDSVDHASLVCAGKLIWETRGERMLAIGSQGVEYALVAYWREAGLLSKRMSPANPGKVDRIAIVSGSCSPITADQIDWARVNGFEPIRVNPALAVDERAWRDELDQASTAALSSLSSGRDPVVYTAHGPDDPSTDRFRTSIETSGKNDSDVNEDVGKGLGRLLRSVVDRAELKRAVIAGGDTSSHGATALGLYALTALAPAAPGAALCRAHSMDERLADFEIALKGGQMGAPDYFGTVKNGGLVA